MGKYMSYTIKRSLSATLTHSLLIIALVLSLGNKDANAQTAPSSSEIAAYTGLHAAVAQGDHSVIQGLIGSGADLNVRDRNGRTPLMVATHLKKTKVARQLLKAGADVNALDSERYDMLTIASVINDLPLVQLAIDSGANAKLVTSPYDGTALIAAAHLGHDEVVRALIAAGAPLDHVNNLSWTALIEAIVLGNGGPRHQDVVQHLVNAGADLNLGDGRDIKPLSLARHGGYTEIAKILEKAGAKP